jgi:uncharacterized membrane protein HdeD (DUF308 family)
LGNFLAEEGRGKDHFLNIQKIKYAVPINIGDMTEEHYPAWLRGFDVIIGIFTIGIGIWIYFSPLMAEYLILLSVSTALLAIGLVRLIRSIALKDLKTISKAMKILSGLGAILLSAVVFLFPDLAISFLIMFIGLAMMVIGMSRVVVGLKEEDLDQLTRMSYIMGGGIVFVLAFGASIFVDLGFFMLTIFFSGALVTLGILRVASGISGKLK